MTTPHRKPAPRKANGRTVTDSLTADLLALFCLEGSDPEEQAQVRNLISKYVKPLEKYKALLFGLIRLTDNEGRNGKWRVTLDWDNYQDIAFVRDADGKAISECCDLRQPDAQFITAISRAIYLPAIHAKRGKGRT